MALSPEDDQWCASWIKTRYDPRARSVIVVGHPPEYVHFHEMSHRVQHLDHPLLWRLWLCPWSRWIPFFRVTFRIVCEYDAHQTARLTLERLGLWNVRNQRAAKIMLHTYHLTLPQE